MNVKLTDRTSVKAVCKAMTREEKATLITGASTFGTAAIERLGIPSALLIDAGGGVNLRQYLSNLLFTGTLKGSEDITGGMGTLSHLVYICDHIEEPEALSQEERDILTSFLDYLKELVPSGDLPSCFPVNSLLASTWNPQITLECGEQVGKEASAFGVDMLLGTPCINIQRDPRGGRGFEGYSEDPYLISKMAPNYARGVQSQGVIADVKHFAVNNQETNRQTIDVTISERAIREIYLPGFKACVQDGGVRNVMTSYNWINGEAAAHNKWLIDDILRKEWGFDGYVVSDWGGVYDQVKALQAGNDLCMPGPRSIQPILDAIKDGHLPEECLDQAVENFLNVLVDMPVMKGKKYHDIDSEAARKVAYRAASEGVILLRNENDTLPLKSGAHVAFYGKRCHRFADSGVGSGRVHTNKTSSMVDCVAEITGADKLTFDCVDENTDAVVVTLFAAGQEGADRDGMDLGPDEKELFHKAAADAASIGKKLIVILNVAAPVDLTNMMEDIGALLCVYFPGQEGGHVAADILFGKVNPSGKLAQTYPKALHQCGTYTNFPGEYDSVHYGEGIYVGYRYFDKHDIEPLYPFGFGLSYTTFALSNLRMEPVFTIDKSARFAVTVRVTNTGSMAGSEVVQLYLRDNISKLHKAERELKGFRKVFLQPGESKEITMYLDWDALSAYDEKMQEWVVEPGWFTVFVGTSSRNLPLQGMFRAIGDNPYGYGANTPYTQIAKDPRALQILLDTVPHGILTKDMVKRQTTYIAFRYTLEDAFHDHVRPHLSAEEANQVFQLLCERLKTVDITDLSMKYQETEIY